MKISKMEPGKIYRWIDCGVAIELNSSSCADDLEAFLPHCEKLIGHLKPTGKFLNFEKEFLVLETVASRLSEKLFYSKILVTCSEEFYWVTYNSLYDTDEIRIVL